VQTEWRALVVIAQLESTEGRNRLLVSLDVGVVDGSSQLHDLLDGGVDVIDSEEEIGSGTRIASMDAGPHIGQRDHITLTRRSRFELPTGTCPSRRPVPWRRPRRRTPRRPVHPTIELLSLGPVTLGTSSLAGARDVTRGHRPAVRLRSGVPGGTTARHGSSRRAHDPRDLRDGRGGPCHRSTRLGRRAVTRSGP